jgi:isocitrate dehydrogenase (NAD+)
VRENTEDLYAGIEHMVGPTPPRASRSSPARASERIARFAFEYAVATAGARSPPSTRPTS